MPGLISIDDAQRIVLAHARPLDAERVPIDRAAGRVLAAEAKAAVDLPPFPSSAMDGFAVRAADTAGAPVTLPLVGEAAAGAPYDATLPPRATVRISTGGAVPEGADAVEPLELVEDGGEAVQFRRAVAAGANVRPRAGDVRAGDTVLGTGAELGPAQVGALAAAGVAAVECARRPRVAILVTGDELRPPGEPLAPGEIYESNAPLLAAAIESAGAVPARLGVVGDDLEEHVRAIERALLGFEVVVTSGGASVGPHDLVREAQRQLGVEERFWGVSLKPGKPIAFGVRRGHLVFNLPGNPVSVLVTFELFVRPALNALVGRADPLPRFHRGRLAAPLRPNAHRHEFVRARSRSVDGEVELEPLRGQESHMVVRAAQADALVSVAPGDAELPAGAAVAYLSLRG